MKEKFQYKQDKEGHVIPR